MLILQFVIFYIDITWILEEMYSQRTGGKVPGIERTFSKQLKLSLTQTAGHNLVSLGSKTLILDTISDD